MKLQPIVYTTDMAGAVAWYGKVLDTSPAYTSDMWTSFSVGDAVLGIHHVGARSGESNMELSLLATDPLERVVARLESAGVNLERPIQDEPFGRSIVVRDPDGSRIQINEHSR